ncbi:MAG: hypothetical protein IJU00_02560 [Selenomonas sp.]|nr:hypothetical protein [Selenomonas sp.]
MDNLDYLMAIGKNEKLFNSLYHAASSQFNLPEGSMWIMYFLILSDDDVTQQDMAERMMFPKQTINSAAMSLVKKGYVTLEKIAGSKKKRLILTAKGRAFAEGTVRHIINAECRAVERMGKVKLSRYIELYGEFYECMRSEFQNEGIMDA